MEAVKTSHTPALLGEEGWNQTRWEPYLPTAGIQGIVLPYSFSILGFWGSTHPGAPIPCPSLRDVCLQPQLLGEFKSISSQVF